MPNQPKFNKHLRDVAAVREQGKSKSRYGLVMTYDTITNTATVLLSAPDSDMAGTLLRNVPCPVQLGLQTVAPEPGTPCWVMFKGDKDNNNAVISHYYNHLYQQYTYERQSTAITGIPNFMTGI